MIKFTNEMGTIAAGGKRGKQRLWSFAGTLGMIGMGLLQSVPAVVGSEALGNGPGLATIKAEELIDLQKQRVDSMQPQRDTELERYEKESKDLKQKQDKLPYDTDGSWNSLYVQLNGEYKDKDKDWSGYQLEQLPLEKKIERLKARQNQEIQKAQKDWEQRESRRQAINNDVEFLAKELPELFKQHFKAEDYSLKSGTEIIRLATVNVWNKASKGDWAGLGFPVFFLALSLITSAAASGLTIAHAGREDVEVSRDPRVGEAIEQYLDDLVQATLDDDYPY